MNEQHRPTHFAIHPGLVITGLVALVVYGWIALPPATLGPWADPTHYALLASYYSGSIRGEFEPYVEYVYRASHFPPVWPALLGVLGGGYDTPGLLKAVTSVCAIAAVLMTWAWVRQEHRDPWLATVLATALALCPGFFFLNLEPHSEALGMVLMLGSLLAATRVPCDRSDAYRGAALFAVLAMTRAICLVFAPALALWILRARGGLRRAMVAGLIVGTPLCLWLLFRSTIPGNVAYSRYWHPDRELAAIGGWFGFMLQRPLDLAEGFVDCLAPIGGSINRIAAFSICALALVGWFQRLLANRLDAWLFGSYAGVLCVWPFPSETERFLVLVLPIAFVSASHAAVTLAARAQLPEGRWVPTVMLFMLLVTGVPSILQGIARATLEIDPELTAAQRAKNYFLAGSEEEARFLAEHGTRARIVAESLQEVIPKGQCVYAVQPTYVFAHGRVPAKSFPDDFLQGRAGPDILETCRYIYYVGGSFVGAGIPSIDIAAALRNWTKPVLVSNQEVTGGSLTAAAILEKTSPSP